MNYLQQINSFWDFAEDKDMSAGQIALYFVLLDMNNKLAWKEWFSVRNAVLVDRLQMTRQGILKDRNKLVEMNLIEVNTRGTMSTMYKVIDLCSCQDSCQVSCQDSCQVSCTLDKHKTIKNTSSDEDVKEKSEKKLKLGEHGLVRLTQKEIDRLQKEYGESLLNDCIVFLDSYIAEKGYKSKSHNLSIRRWVIDAVREKQAKQSKKIPVKKTGFQNFEQSDTDYDSLVQDRLLEKLRSE